jgi:hypothetical protein
MALAGTCVLSAYKAFGIGIRTGSRTTSSLSSPTPIQYARGHLLPLDGAAQGLIVPAKLSSFRYAAKKLIHELNQRDDFCYWYYVVDFASLAALSARI